MSLQNEAGAGRSERRLLILDLDGTLWGGCAVDGIVIGPDGGEEGLAYWLMQRYVKALSQCGVTLAVCSKNNLADARRPFEEWPDMPLQLPDFADFTANWEAKSDNIRAIAERLCFRLEEIVFLDNDPFERAEAKRALPELSVPEMPSRREFWPKILNSLFPENTRLIVRDDVMPTCVSGKRDLSWLNPRPPEVRQAVLGRRLRLDDLKRLYEERLWDHLRASRSIIAFFNVARGCGQSLLAARQAVALAENGQKTILVDFDSSNRYQGFHRNFDRSRPSLYWPAPDALGESELSEPPPLLQLKDNLWLLPFDDMLFKYTGLMWEAGAQSETPPGERGRRAHSYQRYPPQTPEDVDLETMHNYAPERDTPEIWDDRPRRLLSAPMLRVLAAADSIGAEAVILDVPRCESLIHALLPFADHVVVPLRYGDPHDYVGEQLRTVRETLENCRLPWGPRQRRWLEDQVFFELDRPYLPDPPGCVELHYAVNFAPRPNPKRAVKAAVNAWLRRTAFIFRSVMHHKPEEMDMPPDMRRIYTRGALDDPSCLAQFPAWPEGRLTIFSSQPHWLPTCHRPGAFMEKIVRRHCCHGFFDPDRDL